MLRGRQYIADLDQQGGPQLTSSTHGIVAAGHAAAADAAATMLDAGGNAFDAVIAAGFASTVCEPGFTSLAGGGYLLARRADGTDTLWDFFVDTPGRGSGVPQGEPAFEEVVVSFAAAAQTFHCGPGSVAVPGVLAGYLAIHADLGRLPLADVVAPAVALARDGVEVSLTQASVFLLLAPILGRTLASRRIFFPTGELLGRGDTMRNPALGQFLQELGRDPSRTFYRGALAERLVDQMARGGGRLTLDDLTGYRVVQRRPLSFTYRDRTVLTNPPPTYGGALLALALTRLERRGPAGGPHDPERWLAMAEEMAGVDRDRAERHPDVLAALRGDQGDGPTPRPAMNRGTTHVTVADDEGNVAAMTTSNGECSGDIIEGLGIACNNMLGEDDLHPDGFHTGPAGQRVASMMSPTFLLGTDARTVDLALGSGGSKRIRSALLQVITAVVDHGVGLAEAVGAPRLHWDRDHLEVEPGLDELVLEALAAVGPINTWPEQSLYFGGVHAVAPGRTGAGDARRGGAVRVR